MRLRDSYVAGVALLVVGQTIVLRQYLDLSAILWYLVAWVPALALTFTDVPEGPPAHPRANEVEGRRWVTPAIAAAVGALLGLVTAGGVNAYATAYGGCDPAGFGSCGYGIVLLATFVGPLAALLVTGLVLLACRIRHAFFIAVLGIGIPLVIDASLAPSSTPTAILVRSIALGAAGFAVAAVLHLRTVSPVVRITLLAFVYLGSLAVALPPSSSI